MLVAVGDTWQMRWSWRHDSGGKIRYAVTGPQFILISMDGIETHLASNSDLKKKRILTSLYALFIRSSASQTLVKETNYDQFIISKDVMDKSVSNQRGTSCPNVLQNLARNLVGGQEQMHY